MTNAFASFMIRNTKWNLPFWYAGGILTVLAILRAAWNIIHFFGA